jgi:hypothetical protein
MKKKVLSNFGLINISMSKILINIIVIIIKNIIDLNKINTAIDMK